jgi:Sec-independent protein translocase protein TatA
MNFLGIGPFELLLILVIATIVLGPERMAQAGRTLGRLYGQYRIRWQKDVDEMTREFRRELEMLQQEVEEIRQSAESEITAAQTALEGALSTKIDLDPLAVDVAGAKSGATPDAQADRNTISSPEETGSASDAEAAAIESTSEVQAPALTESEPPPEQALSSQAAEETSAEQGSVAVIDPATDPQESPAEAHETDDPLESLSKTPGVQATHSERGEAEGEYS